MTFSVGYGDIFVSIFRMMLSDVNGNYSERKLTIIITEDLQGGILCEIQIFTWEPELVIDETCSWFTYSVYGIVLKSFSHVSGEIKSGIFSLQRKQSGVLFSEPDFYNSPNYIVEQSLMDQENHSNCQFLLPLHQFRTTVAVHLNDVKNYCSKNILMLE